MNKKEEGEGRGGAFIYEYTRQEVWQTILDFGATWFSEDRAMGGAALISWARARCFCFSADLADN